MFSDILLTADYDRTLTAPDSTVPERNLEAIRYFMENGGSFTVNTGRSIPMIEAFREKVPVNAPLLPVTLSRLLTSAHRALACAAPSTCSSRATVSRPFVR